MSNTANILSFADARAAAPRFRVSQTKTKTPAHQVNSTNRSRQMNSRVDVGRYSSVAESSSRPKHAATRDVESGASALRGASSQGSKQGSARMSMGSFSETEERRQSASVAGSHAARSSRARSSKKDSGLAKLTHKFRSAKAERQFERNVGSTDSRNAVPEQSSRAALYEMKMGKDHRRSAQMQEEKKSGKTQNAFAGFNPLAFLVSTRVGQGFAFALIGFLFAFGVLYQPVADWYNEGRSLQQLQAQYELTSAEYEQVKADVDYLSTDEGLADYAHQQLGWLKSGEHSVTVSGLSGDSEQASSGTDAKSTTEILASASAKAETPETWYSGVLDMVFGYEG